METNQTYYTDLLHKYFSGESGPDELNEIADLINKDEVFRREFEEFRKTYDMLQKSNIERNVNVETEWLSFKKTLSSAKQETYTLKPVHTVRKIWGLRLVQIAAVFIIIAVAGFFIRNYMNRDVEKVLTASNETLNASLPDGTKVKLNAGATLTYPKKFKKDKRVVKLEGEAYFEVKHDETQPFLINAVNVCVEVLGTSFYVNTLAKDNQVYVKVVSGRVAVFYPEKPDNRIILTAGEEVTVSKSAMETEIPEKKMPTNSDKIIFNDQKLSSIVSDLNKIYKSDIKLGSQDVGDCRMTATFQNQPLEAVLNVIQSTLDVQITKTNSTFIISGKGCK